MLNNARAKSIIKKLKDKGFARKIDRNEVYAGLEAIDDDRSEFINSLIEVYSAIPELKKV